MITVMASAPLQQLGLDFHLSELRIIPDYASRAAFALKMDTPEELDSVFVYNISLHATFNDDFFPQDKFWRPPISVIPATFIYGLSQYSEDNWKSAGLQKLPLFMDWTDIRFTESLKITWDEFVRNVMAEAYYGEPFDEKKHFNKLPKSAQTIHDANNYLYPTVLTKENVSNIRIRLWIAPGVVGLFNFSAPLISLGFDKSQIGRKPRNKPFRLRRQLFTAVSGFFIMQALHDASQSISKSTLLNVTLDTEPFISEPVQMSIHWRDMMENIKYVPIVNRCLSDLTEFTNLQAHMDYNEVKRIFSFGFASNAIQLIYKMPPELAARLGFGIVDSITKSSSGEKVDDNIDKDKAEELAQNLCNDTGMVIVTDDHTRSIAADGINDLVLAAAMPTSNGTIDLCQSLVFCSTMSPPSTRIPSVAADREGRIPFRFKLFRYIEGNLVPLKWSTHATVFGVLVGVGRQQNPI